MDGVQRKSRTPLDMPLARVNTSRAKSRSPAQPPSRAFLPPAHYAAAGGIPYSSPVGRTATSNPYPTTPSPSPASPSYCSIDTTPLVPMTPDSSFEFKPVSDSRLGTISPRGKRQSTLGNLPLLEAHLLPSLRDTIDRMTRPPSRVSASTVLPCSPSGISTPQPPSRPDRPVSPFSSCSSDIFRSPSTPQPPSKSTPKSTSIPQSFIAAIRDPSQKQKSALKSALRSPTPKLSTLQALVTDLTSPSANSSLRSVKSIIGGERKTPTQIPLATCSSPNDESTGTTWHRKSAPKNYKTNDKPAAGRKGRARSRTDPGAPPKNSTLEAPSTITSQQNPFICGLPRRIDLPSKFGRKDPAAYHALDSSSEIESRYETAARDRRKLMVINAAIVSSSSSESEADVRTPDKRTRLPVLSDRWNRAHGTKGLHDPIVGLGFDLEDGGAKHAVPTPDDDDDELSVYDDDDEDLGSIPPTVTFTHPSSQGDNGVASDDSRKRREALLGIVDGLDLGLGSAIDDRNEDSDTDYCGQEGLAISGSGDVDSRVGRQGGKHTGQDAEPPFDNKQRNSAGGDRISVKGRPLRDDETNPTQSMPMLVVSAEVHYRSGPDQWSTSRPSPLTRLSVPNPSRPSSPCDNLQTGATGAGYENREKNSKSLSRSPVIRQSIGVPRRHSFYADGTSMHPSPNSSLACSDGRPKQRVDDHPYTQTSDASLAESSYAAAARERMAFGIPPSHSDELYRHSDEMLPHATSDLSSVGSTFWHEDCEELSTGAEELFRKLSGSQAKEHDRSSYQEAEDTHGPDEDALFCGSGPRLQIPRNSSPSPRLRHEDIIHVPLADTTWRSSMPPRVYQSLHERHGDMEMQRQEVIWNFRETEELFVNRLLSMVRLFIRPLRAQNSNTWITGVPSDVARLLDWVEDVLNLHTQILSALQTTRHGQLPMVEIVAEPLRSFVPRLEVYQPYLVRVEEVAGTIARLMQDRDNDFGEFVKIQERGSAQSLHSLLMDPQARLAQYTAIFRQLKDVTPKDHPDYLSTFALLHSTDLVIRVMKEVKRREDEYDLIKDISLRFQGLPPTVQLASRERRLLAHGLLQYADTRDFAGTALPFRSSSTSTPPALEVAHLCVPPSSQSDKGTPKRSSRLFDAINEWDVRRGRSGSVKSAVSTSTASSFKSYDTVSSDSTRPITPYSDTPSHCRVLSPSQPSFEDPLHCNAPSQSHVRSTHPLAGAPTCQQNETLKPIPVHAFVFTDIVVLAVPVHAPCQDRQGWRLLDQIGVSRIFGITESPGKCLAEPLMEQLQGAVSQGSGPRVLLDLLPVQARCLDAGIPLAGPSLFSVDLELPGLGPSPKRSDDDRQKWLSAFRQCFQFTLRSLSFPSPAGAGRCTADLAADTERSILSIVASGLPLPKSPSAQLGVQAERYADDKQQEREERGWWSLRFQQVLGELQRQAPGTWAALAN